MGSASGQASSSEASSIGVAQGGRPTSGTSGVLASSNPSDAGGKRSDTHRHWLAQQTGVAARLNAAQQNSWEALAIFAPAVLTAQAMAMPQDHVNLLAMVFIAARMAYVALYAADAATLRTLAWLVGFGASLALFFVR
jgi:uncharacterized MAPEG superfamily protein